MEFVYFLILVATCYFTGKFIEKKHYEKIKKRELLLLKKPYINFENVDTNGKKVQNMQLVASSVVLGCDYFRAILTQLKNIFGGNVLTFEKLTDRARREALLRMREKATKLGADIVVNVKIESIILDTLENFKNPKICVTAYGTAIRYSKITEKF